MCCFLCAACTFEVTEKSFSSSLNEIDEDVAEKRYADAKKKLVSLQKSARKGEEALSIYKRYKVLACEKDALKMLEKALSHDSKNDKLRAAYVDLLLKTGEKAKALKVSSPLKGGKYGSLYSESFLLSKNEKTDFYDELYYPIYYDAWRGTGNEEWLVNCAILRALEGRFQEGAALGKEANDERNSEVWAKIAYDGALYDESVFHAKRALRFYSGTSSSSKLSLRRNASLRMKVLMADAYTKLEDYEEAEKIRSYIVREALLNKDEKAVKEETLYRSVFVNSALSSLNAGNMRRAAELLVYSLNAWDDYVPALTLYSYMARETNRIIVEDEMEKRLRSSGMKTIEMLKRDRRTVIPIQDALYRLDKAISKNKDPLLSILKLSLIFSTDKTLSDKEKTASLYLFLEDAVTSPFVYPPIVLDFALSFIIRRGTISEAFSLFTKHLSSKYGFSYKDEEEFWANVEKCVKDLDIKEAEYAAFFALEQNRGKVARFLHEKAMEKGEVSVATAMNLANIYFSSGNNKAALKLYTGLVGRVLDLRKKSRVVCLVAKVYKKMGNDAGARRFSEYALTLNRANAEADLLLHSLK